MLFIKLNNRSCHPSLQNQTKMKSKISNNKFFEEKRERKEGRKRKKEKKKKRERKKRKKENARKSR